MVGIKLTCLTLFHVCVCSTPAPEFSTSCLCLFHASTWILCFMFVSVPRQQMTSLFHVCVCSTPGPECTASCLCLFNASTCILCFMYVSVPRQHLNYLFHVCVSSTPAPEFSASCVRLFHARTWIINVICRGLFVFSESRWKVIVRFLSFLFISIYKYNAKTNQIYIYSIKYRQITYIQNNTLIYLNFQTFYINYMVFSA